MSRYVETNARIKFCPFCGINRQYITVDKPGNITYYGVQAHIAQVHCHGCGATVEGMTSDDESAVRLATLKWVQRSQLEERPKPIRTQQGRARA